MPSQFSARNKDQSNRHRAAGPSSGADRMAADQARFYSLRRSPTDPSARAPRRRRTAPGGPRHVIGNRWRQQLRLINLPRSKLSAHVAKGIRFAAKTPPLLGHAPSLEARMALRPGCARSGVVMQSALTFSSGRPNELAPTPPHENSGTGGPQQPCEAGRKNNIKSGYIWRDWGLISLGTQCPWLAWHSLAPTGTVPKVMMVARTRQIRDYSVPEAPEMRQTVHEVAVDWCARNHLGLGCDLSARIPPRQLHHVYLAPNAPRTPFRLSPSLAPTANS